MGREVKRVRLDFDWEIGKQWPGYLISHCNDDCDECRKWALLAGIKSDGDSCPHFPTYDPIEGECWQMWETTSEGSPISPVFKTPEELAHWLADTGASSFGSMTATYEQWLETCKIGFSVSCVIDNGTIQSGVEFNEKEEK